MRRTESIESLICYMLVGKYYHLFLKGGGLTQIDAAANLIMEQVYDGGFESGIKDDFRQVLISFFEQRRQIIRPKAVALYLSVLYNLYKKNGNSKNAEKLLNEEGRRYYALLRTDDSAETFSRVIVEILTRIG